MIFLGLVGSVGKCGFFSAKCSQCCVGLVGRAAWLCVCVQLFLMFGLLLVFIFMCVCVCVYVCTILCIFLLLLYFFLGEIICG